MRPASGNWYSTFSFNSVSCSSTFSESSSSSFAPVIRVLKELILFSSGGYNSCTFCLAFTFCDIFWLFYYY
jgi:hypothetical protein